MTIYRRRDPRLAKPALAADPRLARSMASSSGSHEGRMDPLRALPIPNTTQQEEAAFIRLRVAGRSLQPGSCATCQPQAIHGPRESCCAFILRPWGLRQR